MESIMNLNLLWCWNEGCPSIVFSTPRNKMGELRSLHKWGGNVCSLRTAHGRRNLCTYVYCTVLLILRAEHKYVQYVRMRTINTTTKKNPASARRKKKRMGHDNDGSVANPWSSQKRDHMIPRKVGKCLESVPRLILTGKSLEMKDQWSTRSRYSSCIAQRSLSGELGMKWIWILNCFMYLVKTAIKILKIIFFQWNFQNAKRIIIKLPSLSSWAGSILMIASKFKGP